MNDETTPHLDPIDEDAEWQEWLDDWHGDGEEGAPQAGIDADTARRIRRTAHLRGGIQVVGAVIEAVFLVAVGWWGWQMGKISESLADRLFLPILAILVAVAMSVAYWNRRGTWRAVDSSTRAYVDLLLLRERRKRRGICVFLPLFVAFELVLLVPLKWLRLVEDLPADEIWPAFAQSMGRFVLFLGVIALALWWWDRRVRREIDRLQVWNEAMTEPLSDPAPEPLADPDEGARSSQRDT